MYWCGDGEAVKFAKMMTYDELDAWIDALRLLTDRDKDHELWPTHWLYDLIDVAELKERMGGAS